LCDRMLSEFEKKVADYLKANELLGSADRLLLAVSGGADSTALLYAMHAFKAGRVLNAELLCAHINHQLRAGDADLDEEFVIAQATELKVPVTTRRLDVSGYARCSKLSIETAARQLRIQVLGEIARANNCDAIATAHQKNDNAETIIQRLTRGTGLRGLAGIWPERVFADGARIIRPLLCVQRDEIIAYLQEGRLRWRRDRTNSDCAYRRNYIRHRLLPALQRNCRYSIVERLSVLAESARKFYRVICARADESWPDVADCSGDEITLDVGILLTQAPPVKVELVRRALARIGCGEKDMNRLHYENILQLAEQNVTGRKMELPGGFVVCREYGSLILGAAQNRSVEQAPPYVDKSVTLNVPGQTGFGGYAIEATIVKADETGFERFVAGKGDRIEQLDLDKIKMPLIARRRHPGDRFVPLGLASEKKLGKFLTAQRIPHRLREEVRVVADAEKIIWVCPVRISERVKVTSQTRTVLQLLVTDLTGPQNSLDAIQPDK
jgi:tRNA(Ile)-lysidine synthase